MERSFSFRSPSNFFPPFPNFFRRNEKKMKFIRLWSVHFKSRRGKVDSLFCCVLKSSEGRLLFFEKKGPVRPPFFFSYRPFLPISPFSPPEFSLKRVRRKYAQKLPPLGGTDPRFSSRKPSSALFLLAYATVPIFSRSVMMEGSTSASFPNCLFSLLCRYGASTPFFSGHRALLSLLDAPTKGLFSSPYGANPEVARAVLIPPHETI